MPLTAILAMKMHDRVVMLSDTANLSPEDHSVVRFETKMIVLPTAQTILAITGLGVIEHFLKRLAASGRSFQSADDLWTRLPDEMREFHATWMTRYGAAVPGRNINDFSIIIATGGDRPRLGEMHGPYGPAQAAYVRPWMIESTEDAPTGKANRWLSMTGFGGAHLSVDFVAQIRKANQMSDEERDLDTCAAGVSYFESVRHNIFPGEYYAVGGAVEEIALHNTGEIRRRIIREWPADRVGRPLDPLTEHLNNLSDLSNKVAAFDNLSLDGADIASGGTVNLETATGSFVAVTGTTATTAITLSDGHRRRTLAAAAWPITVGASLVLNNGGSSYTCSAGDIIDWIADGTVVRGTVHPISGVMPGVNAAIAAYVAAQDVEVFKGAIDCSTNPNYPAADAGHVYRVSVAGKIGGSSGINVEVNDRLECVVDSTASGNQATVGANWMISQVNIDGAVTGQTSSVDGEIALFSGTSGKVLKRATQTGLLSAASGVLGAVAIGSGLSFSGGTLSATGSGMTDQQRQNALLNMANLSKALGSSLRVLETFADGYKATDGINAGASSNVDTSHTAASGYVGATQGGTTVQINGFDSDLNKASAFTFADRTTAVLNSVTVYSIGIYNTSAGRTYVAKILKRNTSNNYDVVASQSLVHPGGGWFDLVLTTPYAVPGSGTYYLGAYSATGTYSATVSTNARSVFTGEATGSGVTGWIEDSNGTNEPMRYTHTVTTDNMTMVTTTQTADASVSNGRVMMEIDPIDSITLNTDLTAEITADGGTHWTSATLSNIGKGQAGRTVVESADTACTAGTSFAARIKTLNNKSVNVYKTAVAVH
jgi:hypothetical protein